MILKHPLESYVYHYGLKAGLPFGMLHGGMELYERAATLPDHWRRWQAAARLLRDSPWRGFVPREAACRTIGPGEVPGVERLVEVGRRVYADKRDRLAQGPQKAINPFFVLLDRGDHDRYPELVAAATAAPLAAIAADYFGAVPRLEYANVWVTRPNIKEGGPYNSQQWHLDKLCDGILTLFVNVFDVGPQSGPFTFLPADKSAEVRRRTGYERMAVFGDGRLADDRLDDLFGPEHLVSLEGPAGAGGFVDTSVCLHSGSRCEAGERVVAVLRYMPAYRRSACALAGVHLPDEADREVAAMLLAGHA